MDEVQQERMKAAVERKKEESRVRSQQPPQGGVPDRAEEEAKRIRAEEEREMRRGTRNQADARTKSTIHGQTTADKWNQ